MFWFVRNEAALLADFKKRVVELSDKVELVYVNNVLKGKPLESDILVQQALNNSKEQFANSPDLSAELTNAIIDAFEAHSVMSRLALDCEHVRDGLRHILLGPAELHEALRVRGEPEARADG